MLATLAIVARLMFSGDGLEVCATYENVAFDAGERGDCIQDENEDIVCDPQTQTVLRVLFAECHKGERR